MVFLYVGVFFLLASPSLAEWGRTASDLIYLPLHSNISLCADGNGGCWATASPVIFCHIDRFGNFTWGEEQFRILPEPGNNPEMVVAENGDLILAMDIAPDEETQDVYLQRINLDREYIWGDQGIHLDSSDRLQSAWGAYPGPIDNTYLIHWIRHNMGYQNHDLRLQLINDNGNFLWGDDGVGLNRDLIYNSISSIVISNDQCVIATHNLLEDDEGDIQVHKINSEGEHLWDSKFSLQGESVRQTRLRASESDYSGGVILIYEYERRITVNDTLRRFLGVKAMRISDAGDSLWTRQVYEREKEPRGDRFGEIEPVMNYAGSGRFFVAWADFYQAFQVVTINVNGDLIWEEPTDVILNPESYTKLEAVNSYNGVCYVWRDIDDDRENGGSDQQFGQRISLEGERLWGDRGRAIQNRTVWYSSITTDGNGGVITVVESNPTIQMINRNGEIGVVLEVGVDEKNDKQKPRKQAPKLNIYPNPGNSHFQIEFDTGFPNESYNYSIYNLMGRTLMSGILINSPYVVNDLSRFSSGEYILRLQSQRYDVSKRFSLVK